MDARNSIWGYTTSADQPVRDMCREERYLEAPNAPHVNANAGRHFIHKLKALENNSEIGSNRLPAPL